MYEAFNPIVLRYDGLDADQHLIDLGQVGESIQGAAQIFGSVGTVVLTGEYARRSPALAVRVFAGVPRHACWELPAVIMSVAPAGLPVFPHILEMGKELATKALTKVLDAVLKRASGRSDAEMAFDLAEKALTEMGQTSRHAISAVERIAIYQRPSLKLMVAPVGQSCDRLIIGDQRGGSVAIDRAMKEAIEAPPPVIIGPTTEFDILLSELDLKNRTCKFSLRDDDDPDHRIAGEIADPLVMTPGNPYSQALSAQRWLGVLAKPELRNGELEKLYILDISPKTLPA